MKCAISFTLNVHGNSEYASITGLSNVRVTVVVEEICSTVFECTQWISNT